ncbi:hypothetical protein [Herbidospora mongoliensis]|uniref:hypothetical protein n=1 Tax=Herbidospora mongoliensis TaxID=688067 RepID=UPI00082EA333|nr:hypothetical protein [Herbidospora mongoliensis]
MSQWRVLIEENVGGPRNKEWRISDIYQVKGERPEARSIAYELAVRHVPHHPMNLGSRSVYRISDDEYLTTIKGATEKYHYRVVVAELLTLDDTDELS